MGLETFILRGLAETALREDLGQAGDITSRAVIAPNNKATGFLVARGEGVLAGMELARAVFACLDANIRLEVLCEEGSAIQTGDRLARIEGNARAILTGERVALNFLTHLSGIASSAAGLVALIGDHKARLCCTRKTTPGLRAIEKYAHRAGGGVNHRFGLNDGVMIKDNHIALAGSIGAAVAKARAAAGHLLRVEVEIDSPNQLDDALKAGADALLLDNMNPATLAELVQHINGRAIVEASGGVRPETIPAIAASGVDLISTSWTISHAGATDIALDMEAL